MKSLKKQKDIQWINANKDESNDYDIQTQHFDADGMEVTEVDSRRAANRSQSAVYVSELAMKTLDKVPMKKAKSMFQVFSFFNKQFLYKYFLRALTCMCGLFW